MDRLDAIKIFVPVVESGSFSAVARELGVGQPPLVSRSFRRACAVFRPRLYDHRLTILRLRENRMRQSFFDNEPESKWSRSVPERLQQMASHESPRTTKFYDRTKDEITQ